MDHLSETWMHLCKHSCLHLSLAKPQIRKVYSIDYSSARPLLLGEICFKGKGWVGGRQGLGRVGRGVGWGEWGRRGSGGRGVREWNLQSAQQ